MHASPGASHSGNFLLVARGMPSVDSHLDGDDLVSRDFVLRVRLYAVMMLMIHGDAQRLASKHAFEVRCLASLLHGKSSLMFFTVNDEVTVTVGVNVG